MEHQEFLARQFEENRGHLRAVAYRMLGSIAEADDAVQEAWLRLSRADSSTVENLAAWLTTVVARICLDMLRSRSSRREDVLDTEIAEPAATRPSAADPEQEAILADSVGLALLVVLDRLAPAERLAFVLHDMFAVSFEEIGSMIGRTPDAARQLASRARRRVQGADSVSADRAEQRDLVKAFLNALRAGDFEGLIAVLDPDVLVRVDAAAARTGAPREIRGAATWARGAIAFAQAFRQGQPVVALIDGSVGIILAPGGHLQRVVRFTFMNGRIKEADIVADRQRLEQMELGVVEG